MPPNMQEDLELQPSFVNSFWSKDKTGMTKLLNYIKITHDDLDTIHTIYIQRAQLEQEFGEKLLSLSTLQEKNEHDQGVAAAYNAIAMEIKHTAESHLELSNNLSSQINMEFEQKLEDYKTLLEKWQKSLDELYMERQDKTTDLLKIRTKYLKEHDLSKGQPTSTMETLKGEYKSLVAEVDEISQEWNATWKDACQVMEAMEEDRIEFLKSNIWEYANLASARLLIEDEWCEIIRKKLEDCNVESEIERCVSIYGTGSKIPTTNEYVGEQMREYKKKLSSSKAPTPPVKLPRKKDERSNSRSSKSSYQEEEEAPPKPKLRRRHQVLREEENVQDSVPENHKQQYQTQNPRDEVEEEEEEAPKPKPRRNQQRQDDQPKAQSDRNEQVKCFQVYHKEEKENDNNSVKSSSQREPQDDDEHLVNNNDHSKPTEEINKPTQNHIPAQQQPKERKYNSTLDESRMTHIRNSVSDNIGSTASRGQIKRKPLNKSLMDQVSNQMAMARQQRESEQEELSRSSSPQGTINVNSTISPKQRSKSDESLDSLLKTFEVVNPVKKNYSPPPNAAVSDEARSRRQPSEYKPDTGSIPSRRGNVNNNNNNTHVLQEISRHDTTSSMQDQATHPIAQPNNGPPKSPRPPAQQISTEIVQQIDPYNSLRQYQQPAPPPHQQQYNQPSPSMMAQQIPDNMYAHHQQYSSQPQYMNQQHMGQPQQQHMGQPQQPHMGQPQRSPMMQPQRSPMMQAQRSPMMQPRSPMMQPSPMMQAQRSPMMAHSPMIQPAQQHFGGLPPPISIPATNYGVTPQPSPNVSYSNGPGAVSPGGALPPPAVPYNQPQPRPNQYSDGRPILFWARAKYDYMATDQGELTLTAHNLVGVLEADMTQPSWWVGAIWDEYRQAWSIAGSVPSNFMANA